MMEVQIIIYHITFIILFWHKYCKQVVFHIPYIFFIKRCQCWRKNQKKYFLYSEEIQFVLTYLEDLTMLVPLFNGQLANRENVCRPFSGLVYMYVNYEQIKRVFREENKIKTSLYLLFIPHGPFAANHDFTACFLFQLLGSHPSRTQDSTHKIKLKITK